MNITARISSSKSDKGLWLFIDKKEGINHIAHALSVDDPGGTAWAILPEEVEAIRNACNEWLEHESQEAMKHD